VSIQIGSSFREEVRLESGTYWADTLQVASMECDDLSPLSIPTRLIPVVLRWVVLDHSLANAECVVAPFTCSNDQLGKGSQ
jgi:hypothetical protein